MLYQTIWNIIVKMPKRKIAVLTSGWTVDFDLAVLEGLKSVCQRENIDIYVFVSYKFTDASGEQNTTTFAVYDLIDYSAFDGVIFIPALMNDETLTDRLYKKILKSKVPAVAINSVHEGMHCISSSNHLQCRNLIVHLIKKHKIKKFAYIGGPTDNPGAKSNYKAFIEAIESEGLKEKDQIFAGDCHWNYNTAYELSNAIFENGKSAPQAIVCINDQAAMAATKAAVEHGYSVPEDIKIVGFDDIELASKVFPSITTISTLPEEIGKEAIKLLLENPAEITKREVESKIHYRQSCGCIKKINPLQIQYSQTSCKIADIQQRFTSQLRHLEDTFISHSSVSKLSNNLQTYFKSRHFFEGPDFAVFLSRKVIHGMKDINAHKSFSSYDKVMQSIINLQDGEPAKRYKIKTAELIPPNFRSEQSSTYIFFPIFNKKSIYGYYVSKDFAGLLKDKYAYNWTRNFGTIIEKFHQTAVYKAMSEQLFVLSMQDRLSQLYNRQGMEQYGAQLLETNKSNGKQTEILFVDINNMKFINDKFGHMHGDFAIQTVAEAIQISVPKDYVCVRYGGDEFVIIGTKETKVNYSKKIEKALNSIINKLSLPYPLTASIGSKTISAKSPMTLEESIKHADEEMYKSKILFHQNEKDGKKSNTAKAK